MYNNFQEYTAINDCIEKFGAIYSESMFSWVKSYKMPDMDLSLPKTVKQGKIAILIHRRNPIFVQLDDGSKMFFNKDEYKRIDGKPEIGKIMTVHMIRLPGDNSDTPSQIKYCKVN